MIKIKNKLLLFWTIIIIVLLLSLIAIYIVVSSKKNSVKEYKKDYYSFKYDTTWKIKDNKNSTILTHKSNNGKIVISYKVLDTYLIDIDLKNIISDIIYEVEKQNKDYTLINKNSNEDGSYNLLYEKEKEECLVHIYKQDNIILFVYYNNSSKYFDITMDSFEEVLNSIKVYSGEKM